MASQRTREDLDRKHGAERSSRIQGRLGETRGTVCWGGRFPNVSCSDALKKRLRVRWVDAKPVASGYWELSEGIDGSSVRFTVHGGAVFGNAVGSLRGPSLNPLRGPCGSVGNVVWDAWIEPDGSFAARRPSGESAWVAGRFDTPTSASGTYWAGLPTSSCFNGPFGFSARLVDPWPEAAILDRADAERGATRGASATARG